MQRAGARPVHRGENAVGEVAEQGGPRPDPRLGHLLGEQMGLGAESADTRPPAQLAETPRRTGAGHLGHRPDRCAGPFRDHPVLDREGHPRSQQRGGCGGIPRRQVGAQHEQRAEQLGLAGWRLTVGELQRVEHLLGARRLVRDVGQQLLELALLGAVEVAEARPQLLDRQLAAEPHVGRAEQVLPVVGQLRVVERPVHHRHGRLPNPLGGAARDIGVL